MLILLFLPVIGGVHIEKPRSATDPEGATTSPENATDYPHRYNSNTSSVTTDFRQNASITWYNWSTNAAVYESLDLAVTLSASNFVDDEWHVYYDNTTDTTCNGADNLLTASTLAGNLLNPAATNYTVSVPRTQNTSQLELCLVGVQNGGQDGGKTVNMYDIRVNGTLDTTSPQWRNQQQNTTEIVKGDAVELSSQGQDAVNLSHAVLATNETGSWKNKTGNYSSPFSLHTADVWTWSNFTWQNASMQAGTTVSWRIWYNDTAGNYNSTSMTAFKLREPALHVNLTSPPSPFTATQNQTFTLNATVTCQYGDCGEVNGTARYNTSGTAPDTAIPELSGTPFHTASKQNPLSCTLNQGEQCNLTWSVNATGSIGSVWSVDVNVSSNVSTVAANDAANAQVEIFGEKVDLALHWDAANFGSLVVGTEDNAATNNSDKTYNISITSGSDADVWIRGTDLAQENGDDTIGITNLTWNATKNDPTYAAPVTKQFQLLRSGVSAGTNITTYFWMDTPYGIFADNYTGALEVKANRTS